MTTHKVKTPGVIDWIVCAAVRDHKGLIHSLPQPARHHDVLHSMSALGLSVLRQDAEQGFLTSEGEFVRRRRARVIAREANQLKGDAFLHAHELFSEDLW